MVRRNPETGARSLDLLRWGLIPHWAKDEKVGHKMINARTEGVDMKPSFRSAFSKRRCLVPGSGFYEWKREGAGKRPYAIGYKGGERMTFAGLWEGRKTPEGAWLRTFSRSSPPRRTS